MVDNNDTLFREVKEELRREQLAKLWERYGTYVLGAGVAVVALIVGATYWQHRRVELSHAAGAAFETAAGLAQSGKVEEAGKAFGELAASAPKGYAALASLAEAGALMKTDKRPEALAIFERLTSDAGTDPLLSDFARVQAASLRLGEADFTEMENRLKPLTGDGSAWRSIARELLGTAAVRAGKLDEARTTLAPLLADPTLTRTAADRVNRLMAEIAAAELSKTPAAAPAPAATAPDPAAKAEEPGKDADKPAAAP